MSWANLGIEGIEASQGPTDGKKHHGESGKCPLTLGERPKESP